MQSVIRGEVKTQQFIGKNRMSLDVWQRVHENGCRSLNFMSIFET